MAPIFTTQFYVGTVAPGGTTTIYTVQPGSVAVMRDLELVANNGTDFLGVGAGGVNVIFLQGAPVGSVWHAQWQGRVAIGAGNSFSLHNFGTLQINVAATGYVFRA